MATYNLGQAAIVMKGVYAAGTAYLPLNCVTNDGGSWICKKACTGIEPGVTSGWGTYWQSAAVGIKNITVTSASAGTATVKITFSNNTTSSFTYNTNEVADGSITPAMLDRPYPSLGNRIAINSGDDLDNYLTPGAYASKLGSISRTLLNCPTENSFSLNVSNARGETTSGAPSSAAYRYFNQRITDAVTGDIFVRVLFFNYDTTLSKTAWVRLLTTADLFPIRYLAVSDSITSADTGKTLIDDYTNRNNSHIVSLAQAESTSIPFGGEITITAKYCPDITLSFSGVRVYTEGESTLISNVTNPRSRKMLKHATVVLKKVESSTNSGDMWVLLGSTEAVNS